MTCRSKVATIVSLEIQDGRHGRHLESLFFTSPNEPKGPLTRNLVGSIGVTCHGVSLTPCCFVVYSTRRFVVCLSVCHFVLVFFSPFSIAITSLGEERANISAFRTFVRYVLLLDLSVSSSSWGLGRAAVCVCGTPWTFLLLFFEDKKLLK